MRCPVDGTTLVLAERAGVEVDYCPQCRGVWLDRGELDRIVERSGGGYDRERGRDEYRGGRYEQPRRKRSGAFTALTDLLGGGAD